MAKDRLTKRQIERICRIYSASILAAIESDIFSDDSEIREEDRDEIIDEIHRISDRLSSGNSHLFTDIETLVKNEINTD